MPKERAKKEITEAKPRHKQDISLNSARSRQLPKGGESNERRSRAYFAPGLDRRGVSNGGRAGRREGGTVDAPRQIACGSPYSRAGRK